MKLIDRYGEVGLRCNPFAFEAAESAPDDVFVGRGLVAPPEPGASTVVQLIGEKGVGKTTQVHAWRRAANGPYHYVPDKPYRSRWRQPPVGPLVYGDEVDRMPRPLRQLWFAQLARAQATVVVGTHVDLSRSASRCGLTVVTHHLGPVDLVTLRAIADRRMDAARCSAPATALHLDAAEIARVHAACNGSIRRAETLLHQLVASHVAH